MSPSWVLAIIVDMSAYDPYDPASLVESPDERPLPPLVYVLATPSTEALGIAGSLALAPSPPTQGVRLVHVLGEDGRPVAEYALDEGEWAEVLDARGYVLYLADGTRIVNIVPDSPLESLLIPAPVPHAQVRERMWEEGRQAARLEGRVIVEERKRVDDRLQLTTLELVTRPPASAEEAAEASQRIQEIIDGMPVPEEEL